jgi:ParB-like chromosome segregation protein Spo0J
MKTEKIAISKIKLNPNNPRLIKDDKFAKLVQSIKDFPEMLEIRPIVVNDDMIILGGNMRFKACKEAGLKEVSIIKVSGLSAEKQREFLIKDNVSGGEWDWQLLNDWDSLELESWGLDVSKFEQEPTLEELIGEEKNKPATMKITFESPEQLQKAEIDIQEILDRKYKGAYFSVSAGEI